MPRQGTQAAGMFAVAPALNGNQQLVARPSRSHIRALPRTTCPQHLPPCGTLQPSTPEDGARAGKVLDFVAHHRNAAVICCEQRWEAGQQGSAAEQAQSDWWGHWTSNWECHGMAQLLLLLCKTAHIKMLHIGREMRSAQPQRPSSKRTISLPSSAPPRHCTALHCTALLCPAHLPRHCTSLIDPPNTTLHCPAPHPRR